MKNKNNMRCKARKDYVCDNCGAKIPANVVYRRVNIRGLGIYHFCDEKCQEAFEDEINHHYDYELWDCEEF